MLVLASLERLCYIRETTHTAMAQPITLEVLVSYIDQLSMNEKEIVYLRLQQQLRLEKHSQFHVTFNQDLISSTHIRTAATDLAIMDLED
jgi:hypothetical protein